MAGLSGNKLVVRYLKHSNTDNTLYTWEAGAEERTRKANKGYPDYPVKRSAMPGSSAFTKSIQNTIQYSEKLKITQK